MTNKKLSKPKIAFIFIIFISVVLYINNTNNEISGSCFANKESILNNINSNLNLSSNFYSKINQIKWITNKTDIINTLTLDSEQIGASYDEFLKYSESQFKSSCDNIRKTEEQSEKLIYKINQIETKISLIEKDKDSILKESKCYDDKSCNTALTDQLMEEIGKLNNINNKTNCEIQRSDTENAFKNFLQNLSTLKNKIQKLTWFSQSNQYIDIFSLIKQDVEFDTIRIQKRTDNWLKDNCIPVNEQVKIVSRINNEITTQINLVDVIENNKSRILRESGCKTETDCNQTLQSKLLNTLKPNTEVWTKDLDIGLTIDDPKNCYSKKESIANTIQNYINNFDKYKKTINDNVWLTSGSERLKSISPIVEAIEDDYNSIKTQDRASFNANCGKYEELLKVGEDVNKLIVSEMASATEVNNNKNNIISNSRCQQNCNDKLNEKFLSIQKPKEVALNIKYLDPNQNLYAIYPNCYKQKDTMISYVDKTIESQIKFEEKIKDTNWIGSTVDILKWNEKSQEKNKKFVSFLKNATAEEINENCGSWPEIYENYKNERKLLEVTITGIDSVNENKESIIKSSNCAHKEVCNAALKRKLNLIVLPIALENKNDTIIKGLK